MTRKILDWDLEVVGMFADAHTNKEGELSSFSHCLYLLAAYPTFVSHTISPSTGRRLAAKTISLLFKAFLQLPAPPPSTPSLPLLELVPREWTRWKGCSASKYNWASSPPRPEVHVDGNEILRSLVDSPSVLGTGFFLFRSRYLSRSFLFWRFCGICREVRIRWRLKWAMAYFRGAC